MTPDARRHRRFELFAGFALLYTIAVIVFGAWVRVTGSGAGCGKHWPTCHGDVVPRTGMIETAIEFTHRLTSGLCLIFVVIVVVMALRWYPKGHLVRRAAGFSLLFMITEALIGAGLVIFGLVEDNDSIARAFSMSLHLVNTFLLTGAMTLTVLWSQRGHSAHPVFKHGTGATDAVLIASAIGLLLVSMTGAVTALGDTLYPVAADGTPITDRLRLRGYEAAHYLVRLRILHPFLAVAVGLAASIVAAGVAIRSEKRLTQRAGWLCATLLFAQLAIGALNIALSAPGWMQLIHLAMATFVWIAFVVMTFAERTTYGAAAPISVAESGAGS